jgi:homospermidine synthase
MADQTVHARIDGPIVMIGFGSIGRGMLPLIERHFATACDSSTKR